MRKLTQLNVPQNTDTTNFPDGAILNETSLSDGTPVVEEVYGDVLTNVYRLLRDSGIDANGLQDNNTNGYQVIEALKRLPNAINDIIQPMSLSGTLWSVPINLSTLPNGYFLLVTASENFDESQTYTFRGSESTPVLTFTSNNNFLAGNILLLRISSSSVQAINISTSPIGAGTNNLTSSITLSLSHNGSALILSQNQNIDIIIDSNTVYPDGYSVFIQVRSNASGQVLTDPSNIDNTNDLSLQTNSANLLFYSQPLNIWFLDK